MNGLKQPDSKSIVHDFQKVSNALKAAHKNTDVILRGQYLAESLDEIIPRTLGKLNCRVGKCLCQTANSHQGSADEKDYLQVTAEARLKLDSNKVSVMPPCILWSNRRRRLHACQTLIESRDIWSPDTDDSRDIASFFGSHLWKRTRGSSPLWLDS